MATPCLRQSIHFLAIVRQRLQFGVSFRPMQLPAFFWHFCGKFFFVFSSKVFICRTVQVIENKYKYAKCGIDERRNCVATYKIIFLFLFLLRSKPESKTTVAWRDHNSSDTPMRCGSQPSFAFILYSGTLVCFLWRRVAYIRCQEPKLRIFPTPGSQLFITRVLHPRYHWHWQFLSHLHSLKCDWLQKKKNSACFPTYGRSLQRFSLSFLEAF